MSNIDTSHIEGFDGMTAEQKVEALLKLEIPEAVDLSGFVKKSVFDAKASEAAELSKKLKGKMSEDELAEAERQRMQAENDQKRTADDRNDLAVVIDIVFQGTDRSRKQEESQRDAQCEKQSRNKDSDSVIMYVSFFVCSFAVTRQIGHIKRDERQYTG